ncbi:MAG: hypothetical protein Kow00122_08520 [Thermoleophilia bacterium]
MQLTVRRRLADRIWQWRKLTYAGSAALVLVTLLAAFLSITAPAAVVPVSTEPTFFEAGRAFRAAQDLRTRFAERPVGSTAAAGAAAWYEKRLDELQIPHTTDTFTARLGKTAVTLRNIAVVLPGETPEAILVATPRNTADQRRLRPLAAAGGTAVLLDLIQVFAARPHEMTLIFLSTEDEGYAGLGISRFLETDAAATKVRAVLTFAGLGREQREELQAGISGPDSVTPGWYVQLAEEVLGNSGLRLRLPGFTRQVVDHALRLAQGDQVAGLRLGIPSLRLYDDGAGETTSAGLATQGVALERLILSLDGGTEIPADPGTALVLSSGRYLTQRALAILGVFTLLPGAVMALTWLAVTRVRPDAWLRYLRNLVSFVLPLSASVAVVWLVALAGALPRYPYQAPPDAPAVTAPDWPVAGLLVLLGLILFILSRHFLGYLRPREPLVMAETVKLSLGLSVLVAGLALLTSHSSFSLLTGITAAWVWPLATCFAEPRRATAPWWPRPRTNIPLLLTGLSAPALLYGYLASTTDLHVWNGWWFLLVQSVSGAYGVRGPVASVLITTGFLVLLGVRRLQLIPIETLGEHDELAMVERPRRRTRPGGKIQCPETPRRSADQR